MNHFPSVYVRFRFSTYPVIHYFSMLDLDLALTLLSTISLCQLALSRYPVFSFTCIEYFSMLDVCLAQHPFTFTWYTKIEDIQYLHLPSIFNYKYLVIFHINTLNTSTIPPTYPYQHTYHHSYKKLTYYGNSYLHTILSLFHYIIIPSIPISTLFIYYLTQLSLSFPIILPTHLSTTILPYSIHIYTTPITILPTTQIYHSIPSKIRRRRYIFFQLFIIIISI